MKKINLNQSPEDLAEDLKNLQLSELLDIARSLRDKADSGERDFMVYLRAFEISKKWSESFTGTFASYVTQNHLCTMERYSRCVLAIKSISSENLKTIGLEAGKQLVRIEDKTDRGRALQEMLLRSVDSGMPLSRQTASSIIAPLIQVRSRVSGLALKIFELERHNHELLQEVVRLRGLVEQLGGDPLAGSSFQSVEVNVPGAKRKR